MAIAKERPFYYLADLDVDAVERAQLPGLLGRVVEIEAKIRLRLAEVPIASAVAPPSRVIDADEMAAIAGTSTRTILAKTRGLRFRCDINRKLPRADEAGFRRWLVDGRRRT